MLRVRTYVPPVLSALALLAALVSASALAQTTAPPQKATPAATTTPPSTTAPPPATVPAQAKASIVADSLEQRILACAQCHGKQGEGVRKNDYYPRLAGKPVEYLYNQLIGFRGKTRSASPIMTYMVGGLSDNYLHEIAGHYAALRPEFPAPAPAPTGQRLALGEKLVMKGDAEREIPACVSCHGETLTGLLPGIPGLVGLFPDYITAQMGAWKNGKRNSKAPDCMARVASRLSGEDISAVSQYLGSRMVSPTALPAAAQSLKLPLECGSAR